MAEILLSTTETINGKHPRQTLGIVRGNTVRARWVGRDILAGLKNIVGGEIKSYTALLTEARNEAVDRMKAEAKMKGANAVTNVRFATSDVMQGAAEILAYGTAVKI